MTSEMVIEYGWYGLSLIIFLAAIVRTRCGITAFGSMPLRQSTIRFYDITIVVLIYLMASIIAGIALGKTEEGQVRQWWRQDLAGLIQMIGWLVCSGVIIVFSKRWFQKGIKKGLGLRFDQPIKTIAIAVSHSIVVFGLTFATMKLTVWFCQHVFNYDVVQVHTTLQMLKENPPLLSKLVLFISPAFVAPVIEELLFRGMLQNYLIGLMTGKVQEANPEGLTSPQVESMQRFMLTVARWLGIIFASIFFMLMHGAIQQWPALFVLALGFGYVYERTGNLVIVILMHAFFNILNLVMTLVALKAA